MSLGFGDEHVHVDAWAQPWPFVMGVGQRGALEDNRGAAPRFEPLDDSHQLAASCRSSIAATRVSATRRAARWSVSPAA